MNEKAPAAITGEHLDTILNAKPQGETLAEQKVREKAEYRESIKESEGKIEQIDKEIKSLEEMFKFMFPSKPLVAKDAYQKGQTYIDSLKSKRKQEEIFLENWKDGFYRSSQ